MGTVPENSISNLPKSARLRKVSAVLQFPANRSSQGSRSVDSDQLHETARDVPILYVQVAVLVPVGAMRAVEDSFDPFVLCDTVIHSRRRIGIVAQDRDDRVALVQNDDSPV